MIKKKNLLIFGRPGIGKTTVIRKVLESLSQKAGGFYTQEVRERGMRIGFDIITTEGKQGILSRAGYSSPWRVGRYGVKQEDLEGIAVTSIRRALKEGKVVIIDEIGKMELFSPRFREAVLEALNSPLPVLATIMEAEHPFARALKQREDVELIRVGENNRELLPQVLAAKIKSLQV